MTEEKEKLRNTVDKLRESRALRDQQEVLKKEQEADYAKALNDMAASPSGRLVLRTLIRACGVFTPKEGVDGVSLIENNARRNLYLRYIRPYLEPVNKQELET